MMTSILNNKKISRAFAAAFIVMCLCLLPTKVGVCALVFGVTFKFLKLSVANRCAILFAGLLLMTFIFGSGFDIFVKIGLGFCGFAVAFAGKYGILYINIGTRLTKGTFLCQHKEKTKRMHKKSLKALFSCFKALSFIYVFQAVHCVCCLTKICSAVSVVAFFVYVFFFAFSFLPVLPLYI